MPYCSQEKETGALLFLGEGNWCTTVLRRKKQVLTVFRRREKVHYCSHEKETGALFTIVSGEEIWCPTVLKRRKLVLYCFQEKRSGD